MKSLSQSIDEARDIFVRKLCELGVKRSAALSLWDMAFVCGQATQMEKSQRDLADFMNRMKTIGITMLMLLTMVSCADAQSSSQPTAERVFDTEPNYVCFLIRDEAGRGVGGNCVKEN